MQRLLIVLILSLLATGCMTYRTYGSVEYRCVENCRPEVRVGVSGASQYPYIPYESPVVRAARIQGQYNQYKRQEYRDAVGAYCEADPEGCPRGGGNYPYGNRLFGPGGSVLRTPY